MDLVFKTRLKFDGIEALIDQLKQDEENARNYFKAKRLILYVVFKELP